MESKKGKKASIKDRILWNEKDVVVVKKKKVVKKKV